MIYSSADIYRLLASDAIIGASADIKITESGLSLVPQDGIVIYIAKYPEIEDFEARWHLWIVDFDNEPLDVVVDRVRRLLPSFVPFSEGSIIHGTVLEFRTSKTDIEVKIQTADHNLYIDQLEKRFNQLEQSIQHKLLFATLDSRSKDGINGKDGEDGRDGRDGRDIVATDAEIEDLKNVQVEDPKKDQVLTFDGSNWTNKFSTQHYSGTSGVSKAELDRLVGLSERGEPMGHTDKNESIMSFDDATRTFTIGPVGKQFRVWVKGRRYIFRAPLTVQIPDQTGLYFIFFGEDGVLGFQEDYFYWDTEAPTAYVYWDTETQSCPYFAEERHGIVLDWQTHEYLHRTRGAAIANGFDISNYTISGDGTSDAHAQFDLSNGTFFDEDLKVTIVHSEAPALQSFQQDLKGPAKLPVVNKVGATWKIDTATDFPVKKGITHIYYNNFANELWNLAEVENNKYVNYYIIATNNLRAPIVSLMGQVQYANFTDAKNESFSALHLIGFPSKEFRFLYKVTYRAGNYTNQVKAIVSSIQDIRQYVSLPLEIFM